MSNNKHQEGRLIFRDFPFLLRNIVDSPKELYYRGNIDLINKDYIAIVGSRENTSYGEKVCEEIVKDLSFYDIGIISGMARGIDAIAHKNALKYDIPTIAVLGNGVDIVYPKENALLYNEICEKGLLLSEYGVGIGPTKYSFPKRNRIISGLAKGVIVIEASERSGSTITAHLALDQGREVFAVPGNIDQNLSFGTNQLIKKGEAKLYQSIEDILEEVELKKR